MGRICDTCSNYTSAVAIRNGGGSFKTMGRACPKCRVIIIEDTKGYSFIFPENIITIKYSGGES